MRSKSNVTLQRARYYKREYYINDMSLRPLKRRAHKEARVAAQAAIRAEINGRWR